VNSNNRSYSHKQKNIYTTYCSCPLLGRNQGCPEGSCILFYYLITGHRTGSANLVPPCSGVRRQNSLSPPVMQSQIVPQALGVDATIAPQRHVCTGQGGLAQADKLPEHTQPCLSAPLTSQSGEVNSCKETCTITSLLRLRVCDIDSFIDISHKPQSV
jgi:hypothetical protein